MPQPPNELLRIVRAGFVARGTSLAAWCRNESVSRQYATKVLKGAGGGPKARTLRARLVSESGAGCAGARFDAERGEAA